MSPMAVSGMLTRHEQLTCTLVLMLVRITSAPLWSWWSWRLIGFHQLAACVFVTALAVHVASSPLWLRLVVWLTAGWFALRAACIAGTMMRRSRWGHKLSVEFGRQPGLLVIHIGQRSWWKVSPGGYLLVGRFDRRLVPVMVASRQEVGAVAMKTLEAWAPDSRTSELQKGSTACLTVLGPYQLPLPRIRCAHAALIASEANIVHVIRHAQQLLYNHKRGTQPLKRLTITWLTSWYQLVRSH